MRFADEAVVLKRFLLIFSDLIFDSRVDPGRPSLTAAPDGPDTCPLLSRRAASIIAFCCPEDQSEADSDDATD